MARRALALALLLAAAASAAAQEPAPAPEASDYAEFDYAEATAAAADGDAPAPAPAGGAPALVPAAAPALAPEPAPAGRADDLAPYAAAGTLVYNQTGVVLPAEVERLQDNLIEVPAARNDSHLFVRLEYWPCPGGDASACARPEGALPANPDYAGGVDLYCANALVRDWQWSSDRVQGAQVVHVSPHSDAYQLVDAGQRAPAFDCQGAPFGWPYPPINPGPFGYKLEAWYVEPDAMPTALPAQQAAAAAIFDACCGGADACAGWKAATAHGGGAALDLCALDDVVCRGDGAVDALRLAGYGLECDAAALDWSAFASVRFLDLRYNRLSGSFDALAADLAAAMPALVELSVSYNEALGGDLGGEGGGLCALAAAGLEAVQMGVTAVSGALPACLFAPGASLRHVYASRTGVSGELPPTFGAAAPTLVLQVAGAALTGPLPAELPPALLKLNLTHNELTGGLPGIGADGQLTVLDLMQNGFDGAVPESYAAHPALRWLDLDGNALTALPAPWLAEAPAPPANGAPLWYVYLDNNAFAGAAFPAGLALYPNLTGLGLSLAGFAGPLPELPAGGFARLQELGAGGNALTGTVPDSWQGLGLFQDAGAAMGLRYLELQDNALSGVLPEWLADPVPNLVRNLSGNDFSNGCEPQFAALRACPAPPEEGGGGGGGGLSAGAIFGICLVAILAVAAVVGAVVWRRRRAAAAASAGTLAGSGGSPLSSSTFAGRGSRYERFEEAPTAAAQMHTELASRPGNAARESAVYDYAP